METSKKYYVNQRGSILFLTVDNNVDYYVYPRENWKWNECDDDTPRLTPFAREISEQDALKLALNFGMSKEEFYNV